MVSGRAGHFWHLHLEEDSPLYLLGIEGQDQRGDAPRVQAIRGSEVVVVGVDASGRKIQSKVPVKLRASFYPGQAVQSAAERRALARGRPAAGGYLARRLRKGEVGPPKKYGKEQEDA